LALPSLADRRNRRRENPWRWSVLEIPHLRRQRRRASSRASKPFSPTKATTGWRNCSPAKSSWCFVASAVLALASQVLLARWMGSFQFGIYIYVWTWVLMIGALSDVGLSSAARRFIPEYTELKLPCVAYLFGAPTGAVTAMAVAVGTA
jgi:hypothetical protein